MQIYIYIYIYICKSLHFSLSLSLPLSLSLSLSLFLFLFLSIYLSIYLFTQGKTENLQIPLKVYQKYVLQLFSRFLWGKGRKKLKIAVNLQKIRLPIYLWIPLEFWHGISKYYFHFWSQRFLRIVYIQEVILVKFPSTEVIGRFHRQREVRQRGLLRKERVWEREGERKRDRDREKGDKKGWVGRLGFLLYWNVKFCWLFNAKSCLYIYIYIYISLRKKQNRSHKDYKLISILLCILIKSKNTKKNLQDFFISYG